MRKVVVSEFVSLDGVMEGPGPIDSFDLRGWTLPYWNDEIAKFKFDELFASDALLLGRKTYEGFAAAWPSVKDEKGFADRMNSLPKYVVSTSLDNPTWNNARVLEGNAAAEVAKLKAAPGLDILVAGSGELANALIQDNLVDEVRLLIYPVVLGRGRRFFKDGRKIAMKLMEARSFDSGVALLRYAPAPKN